MRLFLASLAVLLCVPATAGAAFAPPLSLPASGGETPRAIALGAGGRGVLITQDGGPPNSTATQSAITFPAGKRSTFDDTTILDSVARQDGGVDLLVRRGSDLGKRADITLRRVLPTGKIYDLWSVRTAATRGALARGRDRTFVAWPEGSSLEIVTRPDGGIPTHPHTASLGLRGYDDLDLGVDAGGRLVAAVTSSRLGLVVASLRSTGTVLRRQVSSKVDGLVQVAVTNGGRVGVLVQDTGIEGDFGECVADGAGRHVYAVLRAHGATSFGSVQTIASPPFGCGSTGALIRALPGDGFAVRYQGGSYDHPPLLAQAATAASGHRFGTPVTVASDARDDTAVVTHAGQLVTALLRKTVDPEVYSGALSILRTPGTEEPVAPGPVSAPLLARGSTGGAVLAWRAGATLQVAADQP
jgi:hypothetical protein